MKLYGNLYESIHSISDIRTVNCSKTDIDNRLAISSSKDLPRFQNIK